MGYFLSSCKCTYLRDNRTAFLSSYFTLRENSFSFGKVLQKYRTPQINLN